MTLIKDPLSPENAEKLEEAAKDITEKAKEQKKLENTKTLMTLARHLSKFFNL